MKGERGQEIAVRIMMMMMMMATTTTTRRRKRSKKDDSELQRGGFKHRTRELASTNTFGHTLTDAMCEFSELCVVLAPSVLDLAVVGHGSHRHHANRRCGDGA